MPIRSTRPDRRRSGRSAIANSANLRLDEPPLIVRMQDRSARSDAVRLEPDCLLELWESISTLRPIAGSREPYMTMNYRCRVTREKVADSRGGVLQIVGSDLRTFGRCRQLDAAGRTQAAGPTAKPGPDAKPRNRANRRCRQRAYQVCLAESRVRRLRVASIGSFPPLFP